MTTMTVQQSAVPTAQTRLSQTLSTQRTTTELDDTAGNTLAEALDTVLHPINGDRVTIGSTPTTGAETTKSEGKATSANAALIPSLRGLFAQFYGGNDTTTVGGSVYDSIANNLN
ncbi:TPA: hypothetical protein DDW35_06300, partial [Candidatus Sumerlaeota bacterium]|nr:hypothetical protein [Candidatus Sumerlaeota bacterium]